MTIIFPSRQVRLLNAKFGDVEDLCATAEHWDLEFKPLSRKSSAGKTSTFQQFSVDGIDHSYARITVAVNQAGAPPSQKLTFTILGADMGDLWWRGHHVSAGNVLVFPRNSELHCISGQDFDTNVVSASDDILAALCEANELPLPTTSVLGEVFHPSASVLNQIRQSLYALRTGQVPAANADYISLIEHLLIEWNRVSGRAMSNNIRGTRNRNRAMRICLDMIAGTDLTQVTPYTLCDRAGVSARTLEYAFKERFDIGPAAFMKSLRMMAVRNALITRKSADQTVGDLASLHGFWHSGQFAKDYQFQFGETPSQTLTRTETAH